MATNLEIKVRCDEATLVTLRSAALTAGAGSFAMLHQIDTYFAVGPQSRFKLREIAREDGRSSAELIVYQRPDDAGSRWSDYRRVPLQPGIVGDIKTALVGTLGVATVVEKQRDAAVLRRTRIHLDRVVALGCFVELETMVQSADTGVDIAREHLEIVQLLGLDRLPVVAGSYADLNRAIEDQGEA